jgi:hypothetical protein
MEMQNRSVLLESDTTINLDIAIDRAVNEIKDQIVARLNDYIFTCKRYLP